MTGDKNGCLTLGIDIGSTTSKCVLMRDGREIVAKSLVQAGTGTKGPGQVFGTVLREAGIDRKDISYVMATGYGRTTFGEMDGQISELSGHAKGMYLVEPRVGTIIDIGGQDAKVIRVSKNGGIDNFIMNDKCAAGTGRFLDVMAGILQLEIGELGTYANMARTPVKISNTCTVFAESEVISQLAKGVSIPDLVAGICDSVAGRVGALAKRAGIREIVCMTGGVAKNDGVRRSLEKELQTPIYVPELAQYMGALGAAVTGYERWKRG